MFQFLISLDLWHQSDIDLHKQVSACNAMCFGTGKFTTFNKLTTTINFCNFIPGLIDVVMGQMCGTKGWWESFWQCIQRVLKFVLWDSIFRKKTNLIDLIDSGCLAFSSILYFCSMSLWARDGVSTLMVHIICWFKKPVATARDGKLILYAGSNVFNILINGSGTCRYSLIYGFVLVILYFYIAVN